MELCLSKPHLVMSSVLAGVERLASERELKFEIHHAAFRTWEVRLNFHELVVVTKCIDKLIEIQNTKPSARWRRTMRLEIKM